VKHLGCLIIIVVKPTAAESVLRALLSEVLNEKTVLETGVLILSWNFEVAILRGLPLTLFKKAESWCVACG
jgi:hypothetical protein